MMQFGIHTFIWEPEWNDKTARSVVPKVRSVGLDLLEIPLLHPETFKAKETRKILDSEGVEAVCSLGLPADATFTKDAQKGKDFLVHALDAVAEAGSDTLTGVLYGTLGGLSGYPPEDWEYEAIAESLSYVADRAKERNIQLGLEAVNRYETNLINTAWQALDLIHKIDRDNVFIHLDTYHMNIEEKGFANPVYASKSKLAYIHLSESDRGIPGTGTVHWDQLFRALADINYSGRVAMESFVAINEDIARATCMWRDIVSDSDKLVNEGLRFLTDKAKEYRLI